MRIVSRGIMAMAMMVPTCPARSQTPANDPFAILRDAYANAAPDAAAAAYAENARYEERYDGASPVIRSGRAAIRAGFSQLFRDLDLTKARRADLNFRLAADGQSGFYRLRVPGMEPLYGRFAVRIAGGKFVSDVSGSATIEDFENAPGPLRFADADEELDARYYDRAIGRYRAPGDDCGLLVTRSIRRYFVLNECDGSWRGLNRKSGRSWTAGARVLDQTGTTPVAFDPAGNGLTWNGTRYARADAVTRTSVTFASDVTLAGTLYCPAAAGRPSPAMVLIHGSGPQDRNGYASLMALYAEHAARRGFTVLSYDKRGVGESRGDWASVGFPQLAADAAAAMAYLRNDPGVDSDRVGLMGSSQAGWVAAEAIRAGAKPAFAILVGAAGAALTVPEQNLYNTEVRMRCARLAEADIAAAIAQQRAFFAARIDPAKTPALRAASAAASGRPAIADWLFPATIAPSPTPQWYDVLDPTFDPLPVWRAYKGRSVFIFGELDDSTPTSIAMARLRGLKGATLATLPGAQHIGLDAADVCAGDLPDTARFDGAFFPILNRALDEIASRADLPRAGSAR